MKGRLTASFLAAAASIASVAYADMGPRVTLENLVRSADLVATGHVSDIWTARDAATSWIYTYVTVDITEVLRGSIDERRIVLKQLGGTVGDESMVVFGQASFTLGEDVLFFAETRPRDRSLYTASQWQGKWSIERDSVTAARVAARAVLDANRGIFGQDIERGDFTALRASILELSAGIPQRETGPLNLAPDMRASRHLEPARISPAFALYNGSPGRWMQFDSGSPIPIDIQAGGQFNVPLGGYTEIGNSEALWAQATPLHFSNGDNSTNCQSTTHTSGHIAFAFNDPCNELSNASDTFALGGYWCTNSGGITLNGVFFCKDTGGYVINSNAAHATDVYGRSASCFQAVQSHMLGHALGLGHSADPSAVMYGTIQSSCYTAAPGLSGDDVAGIRFIYPNVGTGLPPSPVAPSAPSGLSSIVSAQTVTLNWVASATGSPTAYIVEAGSSSGLANLANFSTGTPTTTFTATSVPPGTYFVRLRGANAAGAGAASNEIIVTVQ